MLLAAGLTGAAWAARDAVPRRASDPDACGATVAPAGRPAPFGDTAWVPAGPFCLAARMYGALAPGVGGRSADSTVDLVVVLHGDAPFGPPAYQYGAARAFGAVRPRVVAVALLRPGYADPSGRRSSGARGFALGDSYSASAVDGLAAAVTGLRARTGARRVVVVGHSGGAALAALLLAQHPGIVQAALLVACPCDLPAWRQHMARVQPGLRWLLWRAAPLLGGLSPEAAAARVPRGALGGVPVRVVVGDADPVAPPTLDAALAAGLARAGAAVTVTVLPGAGHEILGDPRVRAEVGALLDTLRGAPRPPER